ncbi:MAG: FAD-dependent oxidoreductase [Candidatus Micrarchaeota archaeon]
MQLYRIDSIKKCSEDVKIFRLVPVEGKTPDFKPGQFLMLELLDAAGNSIEKRPYSIASAPGENYIELAIKMIGGRFTSQLDKLDEGTIVGVEGPLGHFMYEEQKKATFIAGGIGISPLLGMLRHIAKHKIRGEFTLFYSCKNEKELVYYDELKQIAKKHGIKLHVFLTRDCPPNCGYETGRIDAERIKKFVANPQETHFFICGPLKMALALKETLAAAGVPAKNIKFEGWG